jgi:hypothetical protein
MFYQPLLYALLAQVALTFLVWIYLYWTRIGKMLTSGISPQQLANRHEAQALMADVAGPSDNFKNLFETPVLFYMAIAVALVLFIQNPLLDSMAWAFVMLRGVHSVVHITYNRVVHRFIVYFSSTLLLWGMWGYIGWYILTR